MIPDLYAVLGVSPSDDQRVIALAYRRLCRRYHPDVCREPDANVRIREINAAYQVLRDVQCRRVYDLSRRGQAPPTAAWGAAYRAWRDGARAPTTPPPSREARLRVTPGAIDFGFIGRGEIALRRVTVRGLNDRPIVARVLTRGDWLLVDRSELRGHEVGLDVSADPRDLHAFWRGAGPETARLDGWLEIVDANGSLRVPAGGILRRDDCVAAWWNPFARRVG